MIENDNGKLKQEQPKEIKLVIELLPNGGVNVSGILRNEPMALWLLDKAKDVIKAFNIQEQLRNKPVIQKVGGIMDFVRGRKSN